MDEVSLPEWAVQPPESIDDVMMGMAPGAHRMVAMFQGLPKDEFTFEIVKQRNQPGTTFSEEALDGVLNAVSTFIAVRLRRRWLDEDAAPVKMRIHVSLEMEVEK